LAVLVIAGSGRGAGKTAVGCALIAALPELSWVAVKVTPHVHSEVEFPSGAKAHIASDESTYGLKPVHSLLKPMPSSLEEFSMAEAGIWEERERNSDKDTGRYLAAGAAQAFLISDSRNFAASILDALRLAPRSGSLLVESNRIDGALVARVDEPVVSLAVLAGAESDWKASLWTRVGAADALVLTGGLACEELPAELQMKPEFRLIEGEWSSPELIKFVRAHLLPIGN